jgi:hypothetical protein
MKMYEGGSRLHPRMEAFNTPFSISNNSITFIVYPKSFLHIVRFTPDKCHTDMNILSLTKALKELEKEVNKK